MSVSKVIWISVLTGAAAAAGGALITKLWERRGTQADHAELLGSRVREVMDRYEGHR